MAHHLQYIEDYFAGTLSSDEKREFEQRISTDVRFAEEVAFYLTVQKVAQQQARQNRFEELRKKLSHSMPLQRLASTRWAYISYGVAASLLVLAGIWFFMHTAKPTSTQLADTYIETRFAQLPSQMDASSDSLQLGVQLYNKRQYTQALALFSGLAQEHTTALEYAGMAATQLHQYDKAASYFILLASHQELFANNGKFYAALVYLKKGDVNTSRKLLKEICDQHLAGESEAKELLKRM